MLVTEYMSRAVITVQPQTEFHVAVELMHHRNIHHLPVVEAGRIVGIVAERDLLLAAANFGPAEVPVGEIMRSPVVCITDRSTLQSAARMLVLKHIGCLPVVNAKKELVGMITETDVFKVMAGMARPRRPAKPTARRARSAAKSAATGRARPAAKRRAKRT